MLRSWTWGIGLSILLGHTTIILPAETMSRRSFRTSDGVKLSVLEAGAASERQNKLDKPQIAFVPGWCMPAALWRNQLLALGSRYRVLALDPRGQGQSDVPAHGYTAERRAADLHEFLKPLSRVVLVGWSLGALEALQYVHMYGAGKIAGLVLVDSSVGEEPVPPSSGPFTQRLRQNRGKTLEGFVRAIFAKPRPKAEIDSLVRGAKRMSLDNSIALLSTPTPREHWKQIVHAFAEPLLYVVTPQFAAQAENLKTNRPGTQIEIFERAGHALFVDEAARFNALITTFVESVIRK
jgi:non-heme chloroperoxidase